MKIRDILAVHSFLTSTVTACPFRGLLLDLDILIYLNTWHLGVPKFSFKRVRVLEIHPTQPRGGHPSHSNLVRGKLTSPTPNPAGDGTSGLTSYPRRRSKVSEATCLRPQRSAPSRTWTRAVQPRVQRSDHWATHASPEGAYFYFSLVCIYLLCFSFLCIYHFPYRYDFTINSLI